MRKYASRARRRLTSERLEDRQMLAADLAVGPRPPAPPLPPALPLPPPSELTADGTIAPIDGTGNNLENPEWGSTHSELLRLFESEYTDGLSEPAGENRPSAREISNAIANQPESTTNDRGLTDLVWLWGQFVDHDIDLSVGADPSEEFNITVPQGDAHFDPLATGDVEIELNRSQFTVDEDGVRQQLNSITAFLDGSVVYGSDAERAAALRTFERGQLATSDGDLLPFNTAGLDNAGGNSESLFLAGDIRANENAALTAMHTLWVREHNRLADQIAARNPSLSDEDIYQQARAIVVGEIQAITFNEWLPTLLGQDAVAGYQGYDSTVNASITNMFSTAAYRFGHSMISSELLRLHNDGTVIEDGNLSLNDAFFAPQEITEHGIDSILFGAASQIAQEIDSMVVDDVRNFLFGPPGAGGLDLAALNIQRGRDHGLADYNQARVAAGLEPVTSFSEISADAALTSRLESLYGSVDNIDPWVGILAEDHVSGSSLGELGSTILIDQFEKIRDGDRFWYQNRFSGPLLDQIHGTTLADVITRNTDLTNLRENVFVDANSPDNSSDNPTEPSDVPNRESVPPRRVARAPLAKPQGAIRDDGARRTQRPPTRLAPNEPLAPPVLESLMTSGAAPRPSSPITAPVPTVPNRVKPTNPKRGFPVVANEQVIRPAAVDEVMRQFSGVKRTAFF